MLCPPPLFSRISPVKLAKSAKLPSLAVHITHCALPPLCGAHHRHTAGVKLGKYALEAPSLLILCTE